MYIIPVSFRYFLKFLKWQFPPCAGQAAAAEATSRKEESDKANVTHELIIGLGSWETDWDIMVTLWLFNIAMEAMAHL